MGRNTKKPLATYKRLLIPALAIMLVGGLLALNTHATPKSQPITITATQTNTPKSQTQTTPKTPAKPTTKPKVMTPAPTPKATPKPAAKPPLVSKIQHLTPKPSASAPTGSPSSGSGSSAGIPPGGSYSSDNWAGYVAASTGVKYTSVAASWTVPQPTGNGSSITADGTWIGIGGTDPNAVDLIQIGTDNTVSASGKVSTEAFYEMLPAPSITVPGVTVAPGDAISASVDEVSSGQWKLSITDNTSHESYSTVTAYSQSSLSSAEWIEEDPSYANGQFVPFDNFGTVTFFNATTTVDGVTQSIATSSPSSITMVVGTNKRPIATPSAISGTGFTVTQN